MEIWVTGDIHGDFTRLCNTKFPEQKQMRGTQDENFMIVAGDFGLVWNYKGEDKEEKHALDELENRPFTTLFVDGNHENHARLNAMPVEEWHGGLVHKIRPHVIHLMRGEVYDILGQTFFTMGGARSHDISDGVLQIGDPRIKAWSKDISRLFRIEGVDIWYDLEEPNIVDMTHGFDNLAKHNFTVDYIITHDGPEQDLMTLFHGAYIEKNTSFKEFLRTLYKQVNRKSWIFGHHHENYVFRGGDMALFDINYCLYREGDTDEFGKR